MSVRVKVLAAIAAGGALGALARYAAALAFAGSGFPWGTLLANGAGSLLIGLYAGWLARGVLKAVPVQRGFVMTGFCGGFTTFSIFSLEMVLLAGAGDVQAAFVYLGLSISVWMAAVAAGWALAGARWRA